MKQFSNDSPSFLICKSVFTGIILLLISFAGNLHGQKPLLYDIDSLQKAILQIGKNNFGKQIGPDTIVLKNMSLIGRTLFFLGKGQEAKRYCIQTFKTNDSIYLIAKTISKDFYDRTTSYVCRTISNIYEDQGKQDSAIICLKKAIASLSEEKDYSAAVKVYSALSGIYSEMGENNKAFTYLIKALKLAEKHTDYYGMATANSKLSNFYSFREKYAQALPYALLAIKNRKLSGEYRGLINDYNNLANIYAELRKNTEALSLLEEALQLSREHKYKPDEALTLNNLSYYYMGINNFPLGIKYAKQSYEIRRTLEDKEGLLKSLISISTCEQHLKDYKNALNTMKEAALLADEIKHAVDLKVIFKDISAINYSIGKFDQAYDYLLKYMKLNDSLINEAANNQIIEMHTKYETEKKEEQNLNLKVKNELVESNLKDQKRITILSVFFLILTFCFLIYFFYSLRKQKSANKIIETQKKEVEDSKLLIEKQKEIVEEHQKEILDSIHYAQRIQRALLASDSLLQKNLPEHFVLFKPKDIVSGDFYWASLLKNGGFALVTADSTGHGVPGAFMSLLNISYLNEGINERCFTDPAEILNHTRSRLIQALAEDGSSEGGKDGMDCVVCCFDFNKKMLTYSAANNSFYIVRNGEIINCSSDKMPVGKSPKENEPFTRKEITLLKGDLVYTLTDGLPDQFGGPKGKKYKYRQLEELLLAIQSLSMKEQQEKINQSFIQWKGDLEQVDDILLIGIKI